MHVAGLKYEQAMLRFKFGNLGRRFVLRLCLNVRAWQGHQRATAVDIRNPASPYVCTILPDFLYFGYMRSIQGHAGFLPSPAGIPPAWLLSPYGRAQPSNDLGVYLEVQRRYNQALSVLIASHKKYLGTFKPLGLYLQLWPGYNYHGPPSNHLRSGRPDSGQVGYGEASVKQHLNQRVARQGQVHPQSKAGRTGLAISKLSKSATVFFELLSATVYIPYTCT